MIQDTADRRCSGEMSGELAADDMDQYNDPALCQLKKCWVYWPWRRPRHAETKRPTGNHNVGLGGGILAVSVSPNRYLE